MFTDDARRVPLWARWTHSWVPAVVAVGVSLLVVLQIVAGTAGFQGPLHSLISDYVATPKSTTVSWVGLCIGVVGVSMRCRIWALSLAAGLDVVFAAERAVRGAAVTFGNGPMIVLTGLVLVAWQRWTGAQRATALRGIALGFLVIIATKVGDTWLRITAMVRPTVLDEYAYLADHALGQPSWVMGWLFEAGGPILTAVLHWVYIELPLAAMVVVVYQLRHVNSAGWPRHFLVRTFLVLGLVGPLIYVLFPVVGPEFAFSPAGQGFQVGDYWPHALPQIRTPRAIAFDDLTARNCMPSMHTSWALATFIHSRRGPRWLRWGGTTWLLGTIAATLGFGYHYGVDLVAGALLCLTVESAMRAQGNRWSRTGLVASGSALLAALLLCCRFLAPVMAQYPLVFGSLIGGATVAFSVGFYAAFFAAGDATRSGPGCDHPQRTFEQVHRPGMQLVAHRLLGFAGTGPRQRALDHDAELETREHRVPGEVRQVAGGVGGIAPHQVVGAGQAVTLAEGMTENR